MRKFLKTEIDLLYEQIQPNEEVLWRGKPRLIPNVAYLSTLVFVLLVTFLMIILRTAQLDIPVLDDWFAMTLILLEIGVIIYTFLYADKYYKKMNDIFYCITSSRLIIFNNKKKRIVFSKLYPTIKLLRLKRSIFDSGSIVFDIDIVDERIVEIGFNNIENADDVFDIINHQLHHTRNK